MDDRSHFEIYLDDSLLGKADGDEETSLKHATDYAVEMAKEYPQREIRILRVTGSIAREYRTIKLTSDRSHYIMKTITLARLPI